MKKLLVTFVLACLTLPAFAQHRHGGHQHHYGGSNNWVGPLIGGVVIGAVLANSRPVQAEPVVIMPPMSPPVPSPVVVTPMVTYYNCLVRVYDPATGSYRNEVMTCVR